MFPELQPRAPLNITVTLCRGHRWVDAPEVGLGQLQARERREQAARERILTTYPRGTVAHPRGRRHGR